MMKSGSGFYQSIEQNIADLATSQASLGVLLRARLTAHSEAMEAHGQSLGELYHLLEEGKRLTDAQSQQQQALLAEHEARLRRHEAHAEEQAQQSASLEHLLERMHVETRRCLDTLATALQAATERLDGLAAEAASLRARLDRLEA